MAFREQKYGLLSSNLKPNLRHVTNHSEGISVSMDSLSILGSSETLVVRSKDLILCQHGYRVQGAIAAIITRAQNITRCRPTSSCSLTKQKTVRVALEVVTKKVFRSQKSSLMMLARTRILPFMRSYDRRQKCMTCSIAHSLLLCLPVLYRHFDV